MTVKEIAIEYGFQIVCGKESLDREVTGSFCCDLLSLVMGRAKSDSIWMTVMGNLNAVAVASLSDISAILLCEGVSMDSEGLAKAKNEDIPILTTDCPIFETAVKISELFK